MENALDTCSDNEIRNGTKIFQHDQQLLNRASRGNQETISGKFRGMKVLPKKSRGTESPVSNLTPTNARSKLLQA
ncbi:nuclear protein involved in pre-rRNA processing [Aspergillus luchuensis]|uniref:Nuclear protein involved in pre-rRNA processing n=1 Tax=Aspergillus kawachii TaxID=1069201 RepID=A0A146FGA9_ASPKA|nr:nuclear protein involved in pre-rRNA processing [Aspergillus luchuensis]